MSQTLDVRTADSEDTGRIRSLVERSMTASYAMSPRDIEAVVDAAFSEERLESLLEDDDRPLLVAATDEGVAGVVKGTHDGERGVVSHLHVHPDHRGRGAGTALFEAIRSTLQDSGATRIQAVALAAATEGGEFYGRFDYAVADKRSVDVGGISTIEYVYGPQADASEDGDADDRGDVPDLPETLTDDGETVYLGEGLLFGTDGPFAPTYADESHHEPYGYYCANCESTAVTVGSSDRLVCESCDNTHQSTENYDGSYL